MINLTSKNKFICQNRLTTFNVTYPRNVRFYLGNYDKQNILHNLKYKIKNSISEETSHRTYVRGEMTNWESFLYDKDFSVFFTEIMNQYKHIIAPNSIFGNELKVIEVWGTILKKGDHIALHQHNTLHGILYLTEGTPLIFPELEIEIKPKPGDWIISDPFLFHGTEIVETNDERINIVFNFQFNDNFRKVNEKFKDTK
jgi:hypothetical protein